MVNRQILLIEDNPLEAFFIQQSLAEQRLDPFHVCHVTTLNEAEERFTYQTFDLVLTDLNLPDSRGMNTLRQLRPKIPNTPIVVLISEEEESSAIKALHNGAQDYLIKTLTTKDILIKTIRFTLERFQIQAKLQNLHRIIGMGQLTSGVAHELINPASFVLMNLLQIKDQIKVAGNRATDCLSHPLTDDLKEMVQDGIQGMQRVCNCLEELRSFSGRQDDQPRKVDINEIVETLCNIFANQIKHRAQLVKDLQQVPTISANRRAIIQIVMNLLTNAIDSISNETPRENQIHIVTSCEQGQVSLTIEDTGSGITPSAKDRIFEPFFTEKCQTHRAGLGLSITNELVKKYGGKITFESEVGTGTRFHITFPTTDTIQQHTVISGADNDGIIQPTQRAKVLIIDDEPLFLKAVCRALSHFHDVVGASDGRQGFAIIQQNPNMDVIFCDLMMPDLDGPAFYKKLQEMFPPCCKKLVFLTGGVAAPHIRDFVATIENPVFEKPVSVKQLCRIVTKLTEKEANP